MNDKMRARLVTNDYDFREFMIDHAARVDVVCTHLQKCSAEQFRRLGAVEVNQATTSEQVRGVEKRLDAASGRASGLGAAAGAVGGFLGGLLQGAMGRGGGA
jgi:hypothetical protein